MKSVAALTRKLKEVAQKLRIAKQIEKKNAKKNNNAKIQKEFAEYPQVMLHRRRGWTHRHERISMAYFLRNGISATAIAAKFAVSAMTVYHHNALLKKLGTF